MNGRATAYVCEGRVCDLPTTDLEVVARQIAKVTSYEGLQSSSLKPSVVPRPWEFDPQGNRHWHPGHRHWHDGPPPPENVRP